MATKRRTTRRATPPRRRQPAVRKRPVRRARPPRGGRLHNRIVSKLMVRAAAHMEDHSTVIRSRKDAAILRATHQGCTTCHGNGQIFTKDKKSGAFTGSKPCPAKPTKEKVSRWEVYKASRFGADRRTGLVGWACPCGRKTKPRYRDAREATKALRAHEKDKHGSKSVGGAWYAQSTEAAAHVEPPTRQPTQSKVVTDSGMTDEQWIKRNKAVHPATAISRGHCWMCAGNGSLHGAFGGQQILAVCPECQGTGKARTAA